MKNEVTKGKLNLGKVTIQNLNESLLLDMRQLNGVKGGTDVVVLGTTYLKIYCLQPA